MRLGASIIHRESAQFYGIYDGRIELAYALQSLLVLAFKLEPAHVEKEHHTGRWIFQVPREKVCIFTTAIAIRIFLRLSPRQRGFGVRNQNDPVWREQRQGARIVQ